MWNFKAYNDFTLQSAYESSGPSGLWLYPVYFCSMEQPGAFQFPPPPPLDGMVVHRRVTSGGKFCTVNFTLRRNKLIISRSQLCFWFFINVSFLSKRQLCTFFSALSSPLILLLLRIKISRARWPPYFALGRVALERIQIFPTFGEEKNWQKFRKYQILVVVALDEHVGTKTLPIEIYVTRSIFLS